jgi:hypothetical protein
MLDREQGYEEEIVLCGASKYTKKFYLDPLFDGLPDGIKTDLQIMCVLYTEEIGGELTLLFDDLGNLQMRTEAEAGDYLYDEIGAVLKIKQLRRERDELFEALETYFKVFVLGQSYEQVEKELEEGKETEED